MALFCGHVSAIFFLLISLPYWNKLKLRRGAFLSFSVVDITWIIYFLILISVLRFAEKDFSASNRQKLLTINDTV